MAEGVSEEDLETFLSKLVFTHSAYKKLLLLRFNEV